MAVVSKGEPAFVEADGFEGWHFPQEDGGVWAGYHPASTMDVVEHLVQLHERGARYFFLPAWTLWWLEHYAGLGDYLQGQGRLVASSESGGVLYGFGADPLPRMPADNDERAAVNAVDDVTRPASGDHRRNRRQDDGRGTTGEQGVGLKAGSGRHGPARPPVGRRTVSVLSWNVTHNPLGRAHLLAEMLADDFDVELVGGRFAEFGPGVWPPHATSPLPLRSYEGGRFPALLQRMEEMAATITSDVVLVSKPRLPSLGLGILAKAARNRPLVLDVDDWELSFVKAERGLTLEQLRTKAANDVIHNPYGRLWTQYCESIIGDADAITVSNHVLGDRYGGTVIPHARDERRFDPARYDRDRVRSALGFAADERVILFGGTPRRHKGVVDVARALHQIGDPRLQLCLIATAEYEELRADLEPYAAHVRVVPYQPFDELPALLAAADMVCVLQDEQSAVSDYQIPAKVTDALAMQVPCLVRPVPPLRPLVGRHLECFEGDDLAERLRELFADYGSVLARARANRELFLERFSYGAVRPVLRRVVEDSIDAVRPVPASFREMIAFQREIFAGTVPPEPPLRSAARAGGSPPSGEGATGFDVVMLWKQNDTGIYGRRHDMLMAELTRSPLVNQVIQLDTPTTMAALAVPEGSGPNHAALIRERTLARRDGVEPLAGLHQYTYVTDGASPAPGLPWGEDYLSYVAGRLHRHGVGSRPSVLWVYPKNFDFSGIAALLGPDVVVADVVDDNKAWANPGSDYAGRIGRNYEDITAAADIVLVNCEPMRTQMAELVGGPVHLVPNGCELPSATTDDAGRPFELAGLTGPVIGYVGNLSSRLDLDLLDRLAREHPDWNLLLIGSAHAGRDVLRLLDHSNVTMPGPKPYEEAKRYVRYFDVGIIPHLDNSMTQAMNPLKAFVYASLGVPVVSTAIAGLDQLAPLIAVAHDADDFIAKVAAAIDRGRQPLSAEARELLRANSWEDRIGRILDLVVHQLAVPAQAQ